MFYYTQLIFIKQGQEELFHQFEDSVLPLLTHHGGELILRVRPDQGTFIGGSSRCPYEIHIVSFPSKKLFEDYAKDPERVKHISLKDQSVEKVILIEGIAL